VVETWFMGVPLMVKVGVSVRVLGFCLEPISINSVLFILSLSFFAISHSPTDVLQFFIETGLNGVHIAVSICKMCVTSIQSRIRI